MYLSGDVGHGGMKMAGVEEVVAMGGMAGVRVMKDTIDKNKAIPMMPIT